MPEYIVRTLPGETTVRVSRPGGTSRVRTRLTSSTVYITGGGGGDHNDTTNRDAADAHPISAITGLQDALDAAGGSVVVVWRLLSQAQLAGLGATYTSGVSIVLGFNVAAGLRVLVDEAGPNIYSYVADGTNTLLFEDIFDYSVDVAGDRLVPLVEVQVDQLNGDDGWSLYALFDDGPGAPVLVPLGGAALGGGGASALADLTDVDVTSDPPAQDDVLAWDDTENKWTPATLDGGVALSDAAPQDLGTAAAGVSTEASRADHVHAMPTAADVGADPAGTAASAVSALSSVYQPLDPDLTAIAALSTTSYGRAFLALVDAAAGRTALGLGTAATAATGDFQAADSDLAAIAALSTTSFGRSLLTQANAAAARATLGTDGGWNSVMITPAVGEWWGTHYNGGLYSQQVSGGTGFLYYLPLWIPAGVTTVDRISVEVTSNTATALTRLGLYLPDSTGKPGARLVDGGTVDSSAAGVVSVSLGSPPTVTPNSLIYVGLVPQTASASYRQTSNGPLLKGSPIPSSTVANVFARTDTTAWRETGVTGALPATATPVRAAGADCTPLVALRRAS